MTAATLFGGTGVIPVDVALTLAVVTEAFIHGIYTSLFISALPVVFQKRTSKPLTRRVFLFSIISMYFVASFHTILTVYRFIRGYIVLVDPEGGLFYQFDFRRWDNALNNFLLFFMTWLGDALVIFRCYHVWDRNFWVIALPSLLLVSSIGINSTTMYWYSHPFDPHLNTESLIKLVRSLYPVAFAQNFITTSLISVKIWRQYRTSSQFRVQSSGVSLIRVLRIVVESAMIYTLQIFLVVILNVKNDNFQIILQSAIIPSIGIVFVLIAVRVHNAKTPSTTSTIRSDPEVAPTWLHNDTNSTSD